MLMRFTVQNILEKNQRSKIKTIASLASKASSDYSHITQFSMVSLWCNFVRIKCNLHLIAAQANNY